MDHNLPVTVGSWLIAILPLVSLLVMLVFLQWSASVSGGVALGITLVTSILFFDTPLNTTLVGLGKGVWDAFFVLLVVWTALIFYQITLQAGAFSAIRKGIENYSKNYLFLTLAFGWVFASFLQGVVGFGSPIAIVAPLLIGLGLKPLYAVVIPLIGHTWANMFGSLGTSWVATQNIVSLENPAFTALLTAILLWIPNLVSGITIAWIYGKGKAIKEAGPLILVISLIHGGGQVLLSQFNAALSAFIPGIIALGAIILFTQWDRYSEPSELDENSPVLEDEEEEEVDTEETDQVENRADLSLNEAFMPYYFLTIVSVIALGIPAISEFLSQFELGFSVPTVSTGYNYVVQGAEMYSPLTLFTHPGFYLFLSSIFGYFWFKSKDAYPDDFGSKIWDGFKSDAISTTLSISAFLAMSQMLNHSGQNTVLALGIATVSPPIVYAALSNWIGTFGAFMTSSNTSSNILFSPLHESVVSGMEGLSLSLVIAGQSTGGALGNVIAPANIVLGTSTAGNEEDYSSIMNKGLKYTAIAGVLISFAIVLIYLLT